MSLTSNSAAAVVPSHRYEVGPIAASAAEITASLLTIVQQLTESPSLRPGPAVNALFSQLVHTALDTPDDTASAVLDHPTLRALSPRLHDLCARGESELEYEWATRICLLCT